jgi:hypothetical protein
MWRAGGLLFGIASIVLMWAPTVGPVPEVWAQAQPQLDGLYNLVKVEKCEVKCESDPTMKEVTPDTLVFSKYKGKSVYDWVSDTQSTEYSEYQATKAGRSFILCASQYRGDVVQGAATPQVIVTTPIVRNTNRQYRYTLERKSAIVGNPLPSVDPTYCTSKAGTTGDRRFTASVSWERPLLALQSPQAVRRVNGQLLVAVKDDETHRASDADKGLWTCFVSKGFPRLEFLEQPDRAGVQGQRVFVWPDGHFQAILRNGATYEWRFDASGCQTQAQPTGEQVQVPQNASQAEEKVVLACFIIDGHFKDCDSWWLRRPPILP